MRWAAFGAALVLAVMLAALQSHAVAQTTHSTHAGSSVTSSQGAGWNSSIPVNSVAATLTVPAINCHNVRKGHWLGEAAGVELLGAQNYGPTNTQGDFAGVFLYCNGHTAHYQPEFVTFNPVQFKLRFTRAGLHVHPGDTLDLSVSFNASHAILTITDTNTTRAHSVTITGPGFAAGAGFKVGVFPLIDPSGAPRLTGTVSAAGLSFVNGPLRATSVLFTDVTAGGKPLSSLPVVFRTYWYGRNGRPQARATKIATHSAASSGSTFTVYSTPLHGPVVGKTMLAVRVRGTIRYREPGSHRWVILHSARLLPIRTVMDSSGGAVQMTFGLPHHGTQNGLFSGGRFKVRQNRHTGATNIVLAGGNFNTCRRLDGDGDYDNDFLRTATRAAAHERSATTTATAARRRRRRHHHHRRRRIRYLWSNAHGSYTTTGSYGAAAVLGTHWLTEDTCSGTFFKVTRDKILVTVYYPHRHKVVVTQGHSLLAPAPPLPPASSST